MTASLTDLPPELLFYIVLSWLPWSALAALRQTSRALRYNTPSDDEYVTKGLTCLVARKATAPTADERAADVAAYMARIARLQDLGWVLSGGAMQQILLARPFAGSKDLDFFRMAAHAPPPGADPGVDDVLRPKPALDGTRSASIDALGACEITSCENDTMNTGVYGSDTMEEYFVRCVDSHMRITTNLYGKVAGVDLDFNLVGMIQLDANDCYVHPEVLPCASADTPRAKIARVAATILHFDLSCLSCAYVPGCLCVRGGGLPVGTYMPPRRVICPRQRTLRMDGSITDTIAREELPLESLTERMLARICRYWARGYTITHRGKDLSVHVGDDGEFVLTQTACPPRPSA
jgi:hypothetical protein